MERGAGVGDVVVDVAAVAGALVSPARSGSKVPSPPVSWLRSIMTRMMATPSRPARWSQQVGITHCLGAGALAERTDGLSGGAS
jgi:hypothetical protein